VAVRAKDCATIRNRVVHRRHAIGSDGTIVEIEAETVEIGVRVRHLYLHRKSMLHRAR
jgi:hypothetical protein